MLADKPPDGRHFRGVQAKEVRRLIGQLGIRQKEFRRHGFQQRLRASRAGHVDGALGRHDERRVFLPPRLGGFGEVREDGRIAQVAPRFIDHHQFHPRGFVGILKGEPEAFQEIEQRRLTQILMLGGAREVDHLPLGQVEVVTICRVVEIPPPGAAAVPAPHRWPHGGRQGVDKDGHRPASRREGIEVFDAGSDFGRVCTAHGPAADPEQPHDPARQKLQAPLGARQRKGPQPKAAVSGRVVGGQLQVAAPEEPGDPAVRAPEVEDEDARVVLQGLDEQKIEREALPRPGRPEDQRVADVAMKQVVEKGRLPLRFEDGERRAVQVSAARLAGRRAVDRRQARRRARRHEHGSDLPLPRLRRQPAKPRGELAVPFPDRLRVVRREDPEYVTIEAFGLLQVAVQGNGQREIAVGHALRFEFD